MTDRYLRFRFKKNNYVKLRSSYFFISPSENKSKGESDSEGSYILL